MRLGVELTEVADVEDGKDGEKLNVGKEPFLIGSEMLGRTGTTATFEKKVNIHSNNIRISS